MYRVLTFSLVLAIALVGVVSARGLYRPVSPNFSARAAGGIIGDTGRILSGDGFEVVHSEPGVYIIKYNREYFPGNCAAFTVTGFNYYDEPTVIGTARIEGACSDSDQLVVDITIRDAKTLDLVDKSFQFTAVGVPHN